MHMFGGVAKGSAGGIEKRFLVYSEVSWISFHLNDGRLLFDINLFQRGIVPDTQPNLWHHNAGGVKSYNSHSLLLFMEVTLNSVMSVQLPICCHFYNRKTMICSSSRIMNASMITVAEHPLHVRQLP